MQRKEPSIATALSCFSQRVCRLFFALGGAGTILVKGGNGIWDAVDVQESSFSRDLRFPL